MSDFETFPEVCRFGLRGCLAVSLMTSVTLSGCGKPAVNKPPPALNLNINAAMRPVQKSHQPGGRSATSEETNDSRHRDSTGASGESSKGSPKKDADTNGAAAAGDRSVSSTGTSGNGATSNDSETSRTSPAGSSGDGSKDDPGTVDEGRRQSSGLPGRGSTRSKISLEEAQRSAEQQLNRARVAFEAGDFAKAAAAASAAYTAASLYAASDGMCEGLKKKAGALIESLNKNQTPGQRVTVFQ